MPKFTISDRAACSAGPIAFLALGFLAAPAHAGFTFQNVDRYIVTTMQGPHVGPASGPWNVGVAPHDAGGSAYQQSELSYGTFGGIGGGHTWEHPWQNYFAASHLDCHFSSDAPVDFNLGARGPFYVTVSLWHLDPVTSAETLLVSLPGPANPSGWVWATGPIVPGEIYHLRASGLIPLGYAERSFDWSVGFPNVPTPGSFAVFFTALVAASRRHRG